MNGEGPTRRRGAIWAGGLAVLLACAAAAAGAEMTVTADEDGWTVRIRPERRFNAGVLELVDTSSGRVVRALHAGRFRTPHIVTLGRDGLAPGEYELRYREGLGLTHDRTLARPDTDDGRWVNPVDMAIVDGEFYVFDAGLPLEARTPDHAQPRTWVTADGRAVRGGFEGVDEGVLWIRGEGGERVELPVADLDSPDRAQAEAYRALDAAWRARVEAASPRVYRLGPDGEPRDDYAHGGFIDLRRYTGEWPRFRRLGAIAVDDDHVVHIGSGYHHTLAIAPDGERLRLIGGWDSDPFGPKTTGWIDHMAIGPGDRIYLPTGYRNMKVYDRTQPGFDGVLFHVPLPPISRSRAIATDRRGAIYIATAGGRVLRLDDTGETIEEAYESDPVDALYHPTGLSLVGDLVWLAARGPGPGPFWDSGGGGEVLLYWDSGTSIEWVTRLGVPGTGASGLQLLNPAAVLASPDHRTLWIVEDGMPNDDGPPGNARIRRFRIEADHSARTTLTIAPTAE